MLLCSGSESHSVSRLHRASEMLSLGCTILAVVGTGLPKSPCHHLPMAVHVPNVGSVRVNQTMALYCVPVSLSHHHVHPCGVVPSGEVLLQSRAMGLRAVTCSRHGARAPCTRWLPGSARFLEQEKQFLKRSSQMEN